MNWMTLSRILAGIFATIPWEHFATKRPYLPEKTPPVLTEKAPVLSNPTLNPHPTENPPKILPQHSGTSQISAQGRACLPCFSDHWSTVAGSLSEAMRFARIEGVNSPEVLSRISLAEDELNIAERIDGAPEKLVSLPPKEKTLIDEMLIRSRELRHGLSDIRDIQQLEQIAAQAQTNRKVFRDKLFQLQFAALTEAERQKVLTGAEKMLGLKK